MKTLQELLAHPIVFGASRHTALWGTEDWTISAHHADPSAVPLNEFFPDFPLLFKVIDAKSRLSVQVHPNETTCRVTGGEPKTEMWCALSEGPIYAGLKPGTTAREIEAAVASGKFEDLLVRHEAKFGDVFFIPGGLVHAIGDGVRLFEVQQSSNTTFRLYDWGRVGANGRPRELHVAKALEAIDYTLPVPTPRRELKTPFFDFSQREIRGAATLEAGEGFLAVFAARGEVRLGDRPLAEGASALLPPGAKVSAAAGGATVFITRFAW